MLKVGAPGHRFQVDLFSMPPIDFNGQRYRYVMTMVDAFSRYTWVRPLTSKRSAEVGGHLESIFEEHGYPRVLQVCI